LVAYTTAHLRNEDGVFLKEDGVFLRGWQQTVEANQKEVEH